MISPSRSPSFDTTEVNEWEYLNMMDNELFGNRLSSSEFIEDILGNASKELVDLNKLHDFDTQNILLPDTAATAATALKTGNLLIASQQTPSPLEKRDEFANLACKFEQKSSDEEMAALDGHFRLSSGDWVDCEREPDHLASSSGPSYFADTASNDAAAEQLSASPFPLGNPTGANEGCITPLRSLRDPQLAMFPFPDSSIMSGPSACLPGPNRSVSPSLSTIVKKKKRRKQRVLDETRLAVPTNDDILFGRGGSTNKHPGNKIFRQKALKLWPWYKSSTKEEKQKIADVLVECVKSEGRRFLQKDKNGVWREVIGGERTKASQAFRDLHKRPGR